MWQQRGVRVVRQHSERGDSGSTLHVTRCRTKMHAQACIICAKMSAAADEIIAPRVSRTAEEFEQEIDEYTSSDRFAVDVAEAIAISETEVSPSVSSIEAIWSEVASEDAPVLSEFDECQAGFVSAEKAIDAANKYAGLRLTWSRKPAQSQTDRSVANRIPGDGQKYQRLEIGRASCRERV